MAMLHGRRREWRREVVDGVETLVAPDFGPAVVGWRRLEIVLPEWAMDLAGDARGLIVRHEQEHVRHRDPQLLIHASLAVLAMPWNPALWWQYRRLRRAIELDCDARVVRGGASVSRYGEVLLEAGGFCRRSGGADQGADAATGTLAGPQGVGRDRGGGNTDGSGGAGAGSAGPDKSTSHERDVEHRSSGQRHHQPDNLGASRDPRSLY